MAEKVDNNKVIEKNWEQKVFHVSWDKLYLIFLGIICISCFLGLIVSHVSCD